MLLRKNAFAILAQNHCLLVSRTRSTWEGKCVIERAILQLQQGSMPRWLFLSSSLPTEPHNCFFLSPFIHSLPSPTNHHDNISNELIIPCLNKHPSSFSTAQVQTLIKNMASNPKNILPSPGYDSPFDPPPFLSRWTEPLHL